MLKIIKRPNELVYSEWMHIYQESLCIQGKTAYPNLPAGEQLLRAEQDFYSDLRCFLTEGQGCCATYGGIAAVRFEPYKDGVLLEGLETAPEARNSGMATVLINAVISYLSQQGVTTLYSHVEKRNAASLAVHKKCGFCQSEEFAVFIDGSVSCDFVTLQR